MPSEKTSAAGRSLIDAATRTNHAAPDAAVSTRPIHANQASGGRTAAGRRARSPAFAKAGSAMKTTKKTTPATADRRGEMDRAHVDQRVIQSVLPARAFPKGVPIARRHGR